VSAQQPTGKNGKQVGLQRPAQCDPSDYACIALQYDELYKYAVGMEGCIDEACSKRGRRPAELLAPLFKACHEESGGDFEKFESCVADLAALLEGAGRRAQAFRA